MAEIVRATRAADWAEAETRLSDFEVEFPDDPESAVTQGTNWREPATPRSKSGLAQLEAAREVNDPDRVLEIYHGLVRSLDDRATQSRSSATWPSGF